MKKYTRLLLLEWNIVHGNGERTYSYIRILICRHTHRYKHTQTHTRHEESEKKFIISKAQYWQFNNRITMRDFFFFFFFVWRFSKNHINNRHIPYSGSVWWKMKTVNDEQKSKATTTIKEKRRWQRTNEEDIPFVVRVRRY